MNFDSMIQEDRGVNSFQTVDEAVAYEFGYFLEYCQKLAIINGDLPLEAEQASRAKSKVIVVRKSDVMRKYEITKEHTVFTLPQGEVRFAALLPEEVAYALAMCWETVRYLDLPFDTSFSKFQLPPGRSSLFTGVKHITIVDSCYNANLASMAAILAMFAKYPASHKWVVIGDMLEQGRDEAEEHEKLADLLMEMKLERVILMGPRVKAYTYEKLVQSSEFKAKRFVLEAFLYPKEVLDYLEAQLAGGEAVLFKGARFLEGVIEHLLADKRDVSKLSRREKIWEIRRKQWGL
jgi:UDP-N-acetylmuramoyl-tripeptide--D-alanyl-D-alanine ligase